MSASPSRILAVSLAAFAFAAIVFVPIRGGRTAAHPYQTPGATASPTPTPIVVGSVNLRDALLTGTCSRIEIVGAFTATSAVAPIIAMRTHFDSGRSNCEGIEDRVRQAPWESFVLSKPYVASGGSHWYFARLGAQYRDANGNVSAVYCDGEYGLCQGTQMPPTPTATPGPVYAPLVLLDAPTRAPTPTATPLPEDLYFLIETWVHEERGPGCRMIYIDFPTYRFDAETGVMTVQSSNPRLGPTDIGYVGSGDSLSGMGSGSASWLSTFDALPFDDRVELQRIDATGGATIRRDDDVIRLESGGEWTSTSVSESQREPDCVLTTTHRISNYAFQDRRKIEYWSAEAHP